jgi:hypothetical protein
VIFFPLSPHCGCITFYVKDSDDEYETYEFGINDGEAVLSKEVNVSECPATDGENRINSNECAWYGKLMKAKK